MAADGDFVVVWDGGGSSGTDTGDYSIHGQRYASDGSPQGAEFHLISNEDGTTTLSGTSRYRNAMWPGRYWRLWSDLIIHRVHRRVFEHIRQLSEAN